ncbi:alpha/beta hydrolase [Phanerochaete sordida]|uniref:Alpha/beta hydrolase n=1 Tax=Phanerochaete sordida TaxID=48140 RepID=A0A9P3GG12_9APHY|nr:alpha/beta hydrolase [Phanerochaete sordida]
MEVIAQHKGEPIPAQIDITYKALYPILESRRADIERIKRKTFKYGATDRHQLDVYYPTATPTGKAPVLFFVYGGGFASGERQMPAPRDLVYTNVGAFFAKQGLATVIADYRILPNMKFPDPVIDIRDAITWFDEHASEVNAGASVKADTDHIFVMGHSVGAAIVASVFLMPGVFPASLAPRVRGLILKGGAHHFQTKAPVPIPPTLLTAYYGTEAELLERQPLALLKAAPQEVVQRLPEVAVYVSEYEVPSIRESSTDFRQLLSERTGKPVYFGELAGHTHISPHVALGTGQGEDWAIEVADWVKARVIKASL